MNTELPSVFLERLAHILPENCDLGRYFEIPRQKVFRVNTLSAKPELVWQYLADHGIAFKKVEWYVPAFVVQADQADVLLNSSLAARGQIYAQGLESMLAVQILDPKPGEKVLDLCAAPGSKTTQIAAHMCNEGEITANEPVQGRFYRLKSVIDLMGAQVKLKMKDGRYLRMDAVFDRILVDAPCSSEGRFRKESPKTYAYWSLRKIHEMAHKQKGLLLNAVRLLKPGGVLVYSTCTFAPEENEAVVDWFLRKAEGRFRIEPIEVPVPRYPALTAHQGKEFNPQVAGALRVLPDEWTEGFFITKFVCS